MDCRTDGSWVASCDYKSVSRAQLSAWAKDLGSIGLPDFVLGSWPQHPPSAQSPVSERVGTHLQPSGNRNRPAGHTCPALWSGMDLLCIGRQAIPYGLTLPLVLTA